MSVQVTRGNGLLELFLARKRAEQANALIEPAHRFGRILDVGCGSSPYFLRNTTFAEKYGVDQVAGDAVEAAGDPIVLRTLDLHSGVTLPFDDHFFDVATMLAVLEHLEQPAILAIVREVHRVLKPGGTFIGSTPSRWTDGILRGMAHVGLVSSEEIEEHKTLFTRGSLTQSLVEGGFRQGAIRTGSFEFGMNLWFAAEKDRSRFPGDA